MAFDSQKSGDYCSWFMMHRAAVAIGIAAALLVSSPDAIPNYSSLLLLLSSNLT